MAFHNICSKTDQALVAYLIASGAGTAADVFRLKNAGDNTKLPYTAVLSESWTEAQEYSGTALVKATIEVHTNAAPAKDENTETMVLDSDARIQATGDALMTQTADSSDGAGLGDAITTAAAGVSDFTCLSARLTGGEQGRDEKRGEWIEVFHLDLVCAPASNLG